MSNTAENLRPSIVSVDFNKRPRLVAYVGKDGSKIPGLYVMPGKDGFYVRPYCNGKQREKKLNATTLKAAQMQYGELLKAIEAFENKVGPDPFKKTQEPTLADLCVYYKNQGYPGRNGVPREGKQLREEKKRVEWLEKWGKNKPWKELHRADCEDYWKWRKKFIHRGAGGDRTVDLELVTLSNIFNCAMGSRRTGVEANPFAVNRRTFRLSSAVQHCRDFMPRNADELHRLARHMFSSLEREVYGWIILFQAMTGHRIHEILKLRKDAKTKDDPGFISGKRLYLYRSLTHKGTYGHVEIYKALECVIEAHDLWHRKRFPQGNPWYFPSFFGGDVVRDDGLTKILSRATVSLGLPKRTSHGLRAYRVNVLRSQGKTDIEIALLIGQKSQGKLIVQVYGEGLDYKLDYFPTEISPAWDKWLPAESKTGPSAEQQDLDIDEQETHHPSGQKSQASKGTTGRV